MVDEAGLLPQDAGEVHQDLVAYRVAVAVVDFLEMIDVDHGHAEAVSVPAAAFALLFQPVGEVAAVVQSCQFVADGQFSQLRVGSL